MDVREKLVELIDNMLPHEDTALATLNVLRVGVEDGRKNTYLMGWKNRESKKVIRKL